MIRLANGAECGRTANSTRNFGIRAGFAVRNPQQRLPAIFLELRSDQIQREREFMQFSAQIRFQLQNIRLEML
jgi:hypothetical protein